MNPRRTKLDKTDVSKYMEFGNDIQGKSRRIHHSNNDIKESVITSVTPISANGKKYTVSIQGDFTNIALYDSKAMTNGTEGIIYYDTANLDNPQIRPYVLFRISSVPTSNTITTTFDVIIIDDRQDIIDVFGKALKLGTPHVGDTLSWPLVFQNIYNNSTVISKISVSSAGKNNIKFKWEDHSNASVYYRVIYRVFSIEIDNTDVWTETDLIPSVPGIYQEYELQGLTVGTIYEWSVMSYYSEDLKQFSLYYQPTGQFKFT